MGSRPDDSHSPKENKIGSLIKAGAGFLARKACDKLLNSKKVAVPAYAPQTSRILTARDVQVKKSSTLPTEIIKPTTKMASIKEGKIIIRDTWKLVREQEIIVKGPKRSGSPEKAPKQPRAPKSTRSK